MTSGQHRQADDGGQSRSWLLTLGRAPCRWPVQAVQRSHGLAAGVVRHGRPCEEGRDRQIGDGDAHREQEGELAEEGAFPPGDPMSEAEVSRED